jgi:hypothetical protein
LKSPFASYLGAGAKHGHRFNAAKSNKAMPVEARSDTANGRRV